MQFDIDLTQGKRCDQQRSGRCWMFASLNTMRYRVIKKYNLKTFELSQAFPLFYDKLEKSNWFLENILDTLDEPLDGQPGVLPADRPHRRRRAVGHVQAAS
jgi:bleomycin hydrolase